MCRTWRRSSNVNLHMSRPCAVSRGPEHRQIRTLGRSHARGSAQRAQRDQLSIVRLTDERRHTTAQTAGGKHEERLRCRRGRHPHGGLRDHQRSRNERATGATVHQRGFSRPVSIAAGSAAPVRRSGDPQFKGGRRIDRRGKDVQLDAEESGRARCQRGHSREYEGTTPPQEPTRRSPRHCWAPAPIARARQSPSTCTGYDAGEQAVARKRHRAFSPTFRQGPRGVSPYGSPPPAVRPPVQIGP